MSANNQILIKKFRGRFYVFDIMAESWSDENELAIKNADAVCDTEEEAYHKAKELEAKSGQFEEGTEYGIGTKLIKDGADVKLIN